MNTQLPPATGPLLPTIAPNGSPPASEWGPEPSRILGSVVGRLVRLEATAGALVDFPNNPFTRPVSARATVPLDPSQVGSDALLLFETGDPAKPIIVGMLVTPTKAITASAEIDGERIVLHGQREIVLRCGEASLTLTASGKVLIRGNYILTRSTGSNRIKGAAVEIN